MIEVWIDGSCYPVNPGGTACTGYVMKRNGLIIAKGSKIVGKGRGMTNNFAEYKALIAVLEEIRKRQLNNEEIIIKSDSKLLVYQMNGTWKVKSQFIYPLYKEAKNRAVNFNLKIKWIPRELNKEADEMSRVAFSSYSLKENSLKEGPLGKKITKDLLAFKDIIPKNDLKKKVDKKNAEEIFNSPKKYSSFSSIGETENFVVESDRSNKILLLYGKEISGDLPFKLSIKKDEIDNVINLLLKGKNNLETN